MRIVCVFTRFANGYMAAFVDISVEFLVAVSDGAWCRLEISIVS
jgi:hypothetical protein